MWYFAWILGVLLACAFGIINVVWLEFEHLLEVDEETKADDQAQEAAKDATQN